MKGRATVYVERSPPHAVYDALGSIMLPSLLVQATRGTAKGKGGREVFLEFVQAATVGAPQEFGACLDPIQPENMSGLRQLRAKKAAGRKGKEQETKDGNESIDWEDWESKDEEDKEGLETEKED